MARSRGALLLAAGASLLLLSVAAPPPPAALAGLLSAPTARSTTGPLVAAVALLAWATAGWLALTVLLTLAARLPGLAGRVAAAAARRVAPATVRSAVEVAVGITVAVGLTSTPASAAGQPGLAVDQPGLAVDLDWPSAAHVPAAPHGPARGSSAATSPAPAPAAAPDRGAAPAPVVVVPGDTLWDIAEQALVRAGAAPPTDAEVAAAWPRWWSANREVVGDDPDLILPGTVLHPPVAGD